MNKEKLLAMADKWPSAYVARKDVAKFTGGLVSPGTLANADSQGTGPEGRISIGRNVGYPAIALVSWLAERASAERLPSIRAQRRGAK
jgi:hypothetical protein